jgi:hypothetical protein
MDTMTVAPLQWGSLPNIDDVAPMNEGDSECLIEIREVLKRHHMIDRFGVALLHSHFAMSDDEVMVEETDVASRTLTLKPMKEAEARSGNVATIWKLLEGNFETMAHCKVYCQRGGGLFWGHSREHARVGS